MGSAYKICGKNKGETVSFFPQKKGGSVNKKPGVPQSHKEHKGFNLAL